MALSMSIWFIDDTAVTVALPTIERYFDVSSTATQWTITAYLLAAATGVAAAGASPLCQRHACRCSRGRGRGGSRPPPAANGRPATSPVDLKTDRSITTSRSGDYQPRRSGSSAHDD